jgi:hypothetical protein
MPATRDTCPVRHALLLRERQYCERVSVWDAREIACFRVCVCVRERERERCWREEKQEVGGDASVEGGVS